MPALLGEIWVYEGSAISVRNPITIDRARSRLSEPFLTRDIRSVLLACQIFIKVLRIQMKLVGSCQMLVPGSADVVPELCCLTLRSSKFIYAMPVCS